MSDLDLARQRFGIPADHPDAIQLTTDALLRADGEVIVGGQYRDAARIDDDPEIVVVRELLWSTHAMIHAVDSPFVFTDALIVPRTSLRPVLPPLPEAVVVLPRDLARALQRDLGMLTAARFLDNADELTVEHWPAAREFLALMRGLDG